MEQNICHEIENNKLLLLLALEITHQPEDIVIRERSFAWLSCPATGISPITISWYHNGKLLKTKDDPRLELTLDGKLIFYQILASDGGAYYCVASNEMNSVNSKTVTVSIASMY